MSMHLHCDRCETRLRLPFVSPPADQLKLVRGTKQGFLGPVPNVLDLCLDCRASLDEWLAGK